MTSINKSSLALLVLLFSSSAFSQSKVGPTAREVAGRALPSVVLLVFENGHPNGGKLGSGFFVAPDLIATNFHIVEGTKSGYVKLQNNQTKFDVIGLVAVDSPRDLAIIKVKGVKGKPLTVGDSKAVGVGDDVYAIGNPEGLEGTFSTGMVSSVRKRGQESLIQITAPISPGSSGGPVLNTAGEVIGVSMGSMREGEALNFAIPAAYLKALIANQNSVRPLETGERPSDITEVLEAQPATGSADTGSALPLSERRAPKKPDSPSMDTYDVAIARSSAYKEGAVTQIHFFSEGRMQAGMPKDIDVTIGGDECSFKLWPDYRQSQKRTAADLFDYMTLRMDCSKGSFDMTVSTNRIGLNLSPGVYEHAKNPQLPNIKAPGFEMSGVYFCPNAANVTFEIHEIRFDASDRYNVQLTSLGLDFREDCPSAWGTVKGSIYLNYAK